MNSILSLPFKNRANFSSLGKDVNNIWSKTWSGVSVELDCSFWISPFFFCVMPNRSLVDRCLKWSPSEGVRVYEGVVWGCEGEFHKIILSYLRRSFRTLLKGSSSGKFRIYTALNQFSNQIDSYRSPKTTNISLMSRRDSRNRRESRKGEFHKIEEKIFQN